MVTTNVSLLLYGDLSSSSFEYYHSDTASLHIPITVVLLRRREMRLDEMSVGRLNLIDRLSIRHPD